MAQLVVVDEVLVAKRDPEYPLPDQRCHPMLDAGGIAFVSEALREPVHQPDHPIRRAQQQRAGIRRDPPAIEPGHHRPARHRCKAEPIRATLCGHRGTPLVQHKSLQHNNFASLRAPMHLPSVRNAG